MTDIAFEVARHLGAVHRQALLAVHPLLLPLLAVVLVVALPLGAAVMVLTAGLRQLVYGAVWVWVRYLSSPKSGGC
ncbi:hypothetical protein [Nonomuraea sp. NPDC023979]|uniref:hypothetical protein n=1 Tax=Nonomuraea sp. NPDC023979 TaxID=3154796 RepID=UPI0034059F40